MDADTARFFEELHHEVANLKARVAALEQGYRLVDEPSLSDRAPAAEGASTPTPEPKEP